MTKWKFWNRKNIIPEYIIHYMGSLADGLTEKRVDELDCRLVEIVQSKEGNKNYGKTNLRDLWGNIKGLMYK